jgi:Iodothyronine deiodinase
MKKRYGDKVEFLAVYVREAHPTDGWRVSSNDKAGIRVVQPITIDERKAVATTCSGKLHMSMPLVVDDLHDTVGHLYSGMPDRLYLLDHEGRVAYKGGRGPFGFKPGELEHSLIMLLLEQAQSK